MKSEELARYLNETLAASGFKDYCPNGLQVEGRGEVQRVITGVTASQALLEAAVERGADAIVVHHGYFWRGEEACITGLRKRRLSTLLKHDINLLAYHLPLDAHPEWGNNAQWARQMGWIVEGSFGEQNIGLVGRLSTPSALQTLGVQLGRLLEREPLCIGDGDRPIRRLAWCSGGAQSYFEQAIALGVDAYLSGEISEQTVHLARESGVAYLACGHHATERFGVMALASHLREQLGLDCEFVDIQNPV